MFKCKNCGTEMERVYSFENENESYQQMKCPNCGGATKKRPIVYDDNGNLVTNFKKNNKKKKQRKAKEE
jgi:predicted nucleic acid-binding Zn ribbon protein